MEEQAECLKSSILTATLKTTAGAEKLCTPLECVGDASAGCTTVDSQRVESHHPAAPISNFSVGNGGAQ